MTVKELIEALAVMPPNARVFHLWDGSPRTAINVVYEARNGAVITADWGESCYNTKARPKGAPTWSKKRHWATPEAPGGQENLMDLYLFD